MLCQICGLLGHASKKCKNSAPNLCQNCFHTHSNDDNCTVKCKNCGESHFSNEKTCKAIINEIKKLSLNYTDAKLMSKEQISTQNSLILCRNLFYSSTNERFYFYFKKKTLAFGFSLFNIKQIKRDTNRLY